MLTVSTVTRIPKAFVIEHPRGTDIIWPSGLVQRLMYAPVIIR